MEDFFFPFWLFFLPKLDNILQNEYHYITLYNRKGILIYDLTIFLGTDVEWDRDDSCI